MTALGATDVLPNRPYKLVVASQGSTVIKLVRHQRLEMGKVPRVVLFHTKDDERSPYSQAIENGDSVNAVDYTPTTVPIEQICKDASVQKSDKSA